MSTQMIPEIGSTWYEVDKRYSAAQRAVRILAIDGGRVTIKRLHSGRTTYAKLERFGKSGGYRATP